MSLLSSKLPAARLDGKPMGGGWMPVTLLSHINANSFFTLTSLAVHLHNSLILGLIHNASSDVPPPATPKRAHAARVSTALPSSTSDGGSSSDDEVAPRKRLRAMVSGLSKKERQRLQAASRPAARPATAGAVGWAGSGADMIEKKRKDEEKRRTKDDKKRIREVETHIGRKDWRAEAIQNEANVMASRERLALCE